MTWNQKDNVSILLSGCSYLEHVGSKLSPL